MSIIKYSINQIICTLDIGRIRNFKYDLLKSKYAGFREYRSKLSYSSPSYCLIITKNGLMKLHFKKTNLLCNIINIETAARNIIYNLRHCYISKPILCEIKVDNIQLTFDLNFSFTFHTFIVLIKTRLNQYYNIFCRSDHSLECFWIELSNKIDVTEILHAARFIKLKHKYTNAVFHIKYTFFGTSIIRTSLDLDDFIQHMNSLEEVK
jgi:hypothetical protein